MMRNPFADLHQRLLNVPRLLAVVQILVQLLIGEMPPEPGIPPEQKRHEYDQPAGGEKQNFLCARHAALRLGLKGLDRFRWNCVQRVWAGRHRRIISSQNYSICLEITPREICRSGKMQNTVARFPQSSTSASSTRSCSR